MTKLFHVLADLVHIRGIQKRWTRAFKLIIDSTRKSQPVKSNLKISPKSSSIKKKHTQKDDFFQFFSKVDLKDQIKT